MPWEFNAKTQSRKDAKEEVENASRTNTHSLVTLIARANFFFAALRLRVFALKILQPYCMDTAQSVSFRGGKSLGLFLTPAPYTCPCGCPL